MSFPDTTALNQVPHCKDHGPMVVIPTSSTSELGRWCGVWYQCAHTLYRCNNTVLIPSAALLAQLAGQREKSVS
jgi:hypothetical protein